MRIPTSLAAEVAEKEKKHLQLKFDFFQCRFWQNLNTLR